MPVGLNHPVDHKLVLRPFSVNSSSNIDVQSPVSPMGPLASEVSGGEAKGDVGGVVGGGVVGVVETAGVGAGELAVGFLGAVFFALGE
jgi:hypothetical protein